MAAPGFLQHVHDATARYLQTVDRMEPEQASAASVLPDWTRAHVVAHVALNAHGLARALNGVLHDEPIPVYDSVEDRTNDIASHATLPLRDLREISFDACGRFRDAADRLEDWSVEVERTPGGARLTVSEMLMSRWREVEIHHADLLLGHRPRDWSPAFVEAVLPQLLADRSGALDLTLVSPEGRLDVGAGGPEVTGSRADLAWWLMGRGDGEGLSGTLPTLEAWR